MSWISDASANKIVQSYVNNFLDLSGNLKVRNPLEDTASSSSSNSFTQIGSNLTGGGEYYDVFGSSVSMNNDGTIVAIGAPGHKGGHSNGRGSGTVRVYQYDGSSWNELGQEMDNLYTQAIHGSSVSLNGDGTIIAIGAGGASYGKKAFVYEYNASTSLWEKHGDSRAFMPTLRSNGSHSQFGRSIAISDDGTRVVVGDPGVSKRYQMEHKGRLHYYIYDGSQWAGWNGLYPTATTPSQEMDGQVDDGWLANMWFGASVAISGDGLVIAGGGSGGYGWYNGTLLNNHGVVRVYNHLGQQLGSTIIGGGANQYAGAYWGAINEYSEGWGLNSEMLALNSDGTILAIAAYGANSVKVYQYSGSSWSQFGNTITGDVGWCVKLSDDGMTLIAGRKQANSDTGQAKIFKYDGSSWVQEGNEILDPNGVSGDKFGSSVAINSDGTKFVIGAYEANGGDVHSGIAQVYGSSGAGGSGVPMVSTTILDASAGTVSLYNNTMDISSVVVDISGTMWINRGQSGGTVSDDYQCGLVIESEKTSSSEAVLYIETAGQTEAFSIRADGSLYADNSIRYSSDDRKKINEQHITNATETLNKLSPQIYTKLEKFETDGGRPICRESGLIAQDIYYNAPELRHLVDTEATPTENLVYDSSGNLSYDLSENLVYDPSGNLLYDWSGNLVYDRKFNPINRERILQEFRDLVDTEEIPQLYDLVYNLDGNMIYDPSNNLYDREGRDNDLQNDIDYTALGWGDKPAYVNYIGLIPYLIKATQEKQLILDQQKVTIDQQTTEVAELKTRLSSLE